MQSITLNIKNKDTSEKLIWLLEHFGKDEIEIVEREDIEDLKLLAETRGEESIPFEEYLKNKAQNTK